MDSSDSTASAASPGFVAALRNLGDNLVKGLQERLELFSVELQEEKYRLIRTFIWICAAVFTAMMTLAFASLTLVYAFPAGARLGLLGILTGAYAAAFVVVILALRRYLAHQPRPFAATLQEITQDRTCIRDGN